jgi:superfamily II DNA or RNA helicase
VTTHDRVLLKMWCGSGKTLVFVTLILEEQYNLSVVVFPRLALLFQFEKDYVKNHQYLNVFRTTVTLLACDSQTVVLAES